MGVCKEAEYKESWTNSLIKLSKKKGLYFISTPTSEAGIDHIGISSNDQNTPTGKCLVLVTPDAARTMCSTLGISEHLSEKDINFEYLQKSKIFYIEGYMVTSDSNFNSVTKSLDSLVGFGTKKALSLSNDGIVYGFRELSKNELGGISDF